MLHVNGTLCEVTYFPYRNLISEISCVLAVLLIILIVSAAPCALGRLLQGFHLYIGLTLSGYNIANRRAIFK